MSDTAPEFAEPAEPTQENQDVDDVSSEEPDTGEPQEPEKDWEAEVSKWRSMARKHEATAKANAEAARKYAEFEESQKTEQQRLADRVAAAEQRAIAAEIGRAKLVAAAAHNIPMSLLDRLGGTSEDEINEAAEELAAEFEAELGRRLAAVQPPHVPGYEDEPEQPAWSRPVEALTPGSLPAGSEPEDPNEAFRRFLGR
ncbi:MULTISPECIES: hypothetical protein [Streptosporangiaceae]|uniref:hypothetical protein n=1 Tax=Streptosporangiaceae TaxID=2004 RepID=UPI0034075755